MKLFSLLLMIAISLPSFAVSRDDNADDVGPPQVLWLSWCVGDKVMEDIDGAALLKWDCAEKAKKCQQEEKIAGGRRIVYAFCK